MKFHKHNVSETLMKKQNTLISFMKKTLTDMYHYFFNKIKIV